MNLKITDFIRDEAFSQLKEYIKDLDKQHLLLLQENFSKFAQATKRLLEDKSLREKTK